MKAIWKGSITFALVSIPVKLYSAVRKAGVPLHLLHRRCSTPLKYERYCPECDAEVDWEDVIHGYEYDKGRYVLLTDEELQSVHRGGRKTMEILRFIDASGIEPILYDSAFYIEPAEGGERAYLLLRELLRGTGKVALVRTALREREHIGVLRVFRDVLVLQTLHFMDEIIEPDFIRVPEEVRLDRKEYELAKSLMRRFTGAFDISAYRDESRQALMDLITTKVKGGEVKVTPEKEVRKVISLMDALKKSLEEGKTKKRAAR